jgi:uncharacterized protein DUF5681
MFDGPTSQTVSTRDSPERVGRASLALLRLEPTKLGACRPDGRGENAIWMPSLRASADGKARRALSSIQRATCHPRSFHFAGGMLRGRATQRPRKPSDRLWLPSGPLGMSAVRLLFSTLTWFSCAENNRVVLGNHSKCPTLASCPHSRRMIEQIAALPDGSGRVRDIDDERPGDGMNGATYEVGFCKPPLHTRFKPGQSGNPSGRPKGSPNLKTLFQKILNEQIPLREGNQTKKISKGEALVRSLVIHALKGDTRAVMTLLRIAEATGEFEDNEKNRGQRKAKHRRRTQATTTGTRQRQRRYATLLAILLDDIARTGFGSKLLASASSELRAQAGGFSLGAPHELVNRARLAVSRNNGEAQLPRSLIYMSHCTTRRLVRHRQKLVIGSQLWAYDDHISRAKCACHVAASSVQVARIIERH